MMEYPNLGIVLLPLLAIIGTGICAKSKTFAHFYPREYCQIPDCNTKTISNTTAIYECALTNSYTKRWAGFEYVNDACQIFDCFGKRRDCSTKIWGRPCPKESEFRIQTRCYDFITDDTDGWGTSPKKCKNLGYKSLASPGGNGKLKSLRAVATDTDPFPSGYIWIGMKTSNGTFYYPGGGIVTYKDNQMVKPIYSGTEERCLALKGSDEYKLEGIDCTTQAAFSCQTDNDGV